MPAIPLAIILPIIILENVKKITKTLLQLTFQLKVTVFGELGAVVSYVCLVWGGPITIKKIKQNQFICKNLPI